MRRSGQGRVGQQSGNINDANFVASQGLYARLELRQNGSRPHCASHGHAKNVRLTIADGRAALEQRHVLIDYTDNNKQLKTRMFTRLEAFQRNHILRGTGFAWALCSK